MDLLVAIVLAFLLPLAMTIVLETGVAALLGVRGRALTNVVSVNFITNPPLNLLWLGLAYVGIGFARVSPNGGTAHLAPTFWGWFALGLLEVLVVVIEWRLLVWALARRGRSSRRLLTVSAVMNAVSAVFGTFVLARVAG